MDNYQIERIVGRGGFGTVYLCKDKKTFRNVIIKQIPVEQMTSNDRQVLLFIFDFKKTNILYIRSTLYTLGFFLAETVSYSTVQKNFQCIYYINQNRVENFFLNPFHFIL